MTWEWLQVITGLRYDTYSLKGGDIDNSGDRLSPRITVGVSPFEAPRLAGLQFYGTYAEGYRSPSLTETLISGLHPAGITFPFLPNSGLTPETGKTWEFGVNYKTDSIFQSGDALRLKAAYFHNDIDDYIGIVDDIPAGTGACPAVPPHLLACALDLISSAPLKIPAVGMPYERNAAWSLRPCTSMYSHGIALASYQAVISSRTALPAGLSS